MVKQQVKKVETIAFPVEVTKQDIHDGECMLANKCMVRVAVERVLRNLDPKQGNHHTRVDAGHIKFNYKGHHYVADTPKVAKSNLIRFDSEATARRKAKRQGEDFTSAIEPFKIKLIARRMSKVRPLSDERKQEIRDQINVARRKRVAAGQKPKQYTLRKRVVGFA